MLARKIGETRFELWFSQQTPLEFFCRARTESILCVRDFGDESIQPLRRISLAKESQQRAEPKTSACENTLDGTNPGVTEIQVSSALDA